MILVLITATSVTRRGGREGGAKEGREREDFQSKRSDRSQQKSVAMA